MYQRQPTHIMSQKFGVPLLTSCGYPHPCSRRSAYPFNSLSRRRTSPCYPRPCDQLISPTRCEVLDAGLDTLCWEFRQVRVIYGPFKCAALSHFPGSYLTTSLQRVLSTTLGNKVPAFTGRVSLGEADTTSVWRQMSIDTHYVLSLVI